MIDYESSLIHVYMYQYSEYQFQVYICISQHVSITFFCATDLIGSHFLDFIINLHCSARFNMIVRINMRLSVLNEIFHTFIIRIGKAKTNI